MRVLYNIFLAEIKLYMQIYTIPLILFNLNCNFKSVV